MANIKYPGFEKFEQHIMESIHERVEKGILSSHWAKPADPPAYSITGKVSVDRDIQTHAPVWDGVPASKITENIEECTGALDREREAVEKAVRLGIYYGMSPLKIRETFERPTMGEYEYTKAQKWEPTEQDYRECCGTYAIPYGGGNRVVKIAPCDLEPLFASRAVFDRNYSECTKIESIPESEIPRPAEPEKPKEAYNVPFPTLLEFLGV